MRTRSAAYLLGLGLVLIGCDDGGSDIDDADASADEDGGSDEAVTCPPGANEDNEIPDQEGMSGPCCARKSNADDLANPEFRISFLRIDAPGGGAGVSSPAVGGVLQDGVMEERVNWLIRVTGADADGTISITTGLGFRDDSDSSFDFADGNATGMGGPDAWDPLTVETGNITGEVVTAPPLSEVLIVPLIDTDGETLITELPLRALELVEMTMSEDRTCVGAAQAGLNPWTTMDGQLRAYLTIEDVLNRPLVVSVLDTTVCLLLAGLAQSDTVMECDDRPRADWTIKPDSICDADGCTEGGCDEDSTCNAWQLEAVFAAQGVEIN